MVLSDLQRLIIGGLTVCGMEDDDIVSSMLLLDTEEKQWQMADYLDTVVDNPPSRGELFKKAAEISGLVK